MGIHNSFGLSRTGGLEIITPYTNAMKLL